MCARTRCRQTADCLVVMKQLETVDIQEELSQQRFLIGLKNFTLTSNCRSLKKRRLMIVTDSLKKTLSCRWCKCLNQRFLQTSRFMFKPSNYSTVHGEGGEGGVQTPPAAREI